MKCGIVAGTWAGFARAAAAAAVGSWLALAVCPVFAADGAQAAAVAKESAKAFKDYVRDLARSGGRPDYSKEPVAQYLRRIFDSETLAALPPPRGGDMDWLSEWHESADIGIWVLARFGQEKGRDISQTIERNAYEYENEIATAVAFILHLRARVVRTAEISENRKAVQFFGHGVVEAVSFALEIMLDRRKPQDARLIMAAVHDTVSAWAPYTSATKRKRILGQLEEIRVANVDVGVNVAAISEAIRRERR